MFGPLGAMEILFILVLALLIFGPRRLPEVGRTVGKALGEFRRATTDLKRTVNAELALEEEEERPPTERRPAASPVARDGAAEAGRTPPVRRAAGARPRSPSGDPPADETAEGASADREAAGDPSARADE